jgi:hypothetical protein
VAGGPQLTLTATGLPAGLLLESASDGWAVTGRPSVAGRYEVALRASSGNGQAAATWVVTVRPGPASVVSATPSVAQKWADETLGVLVAATDAHGNAVPTAGAVVTWPGDMEGCRFPAGQAPSYRVCRVRASVGVAMSPTQSVDVFDRAALSPQVAPPPRAGLTSMVVNNPWWPGLEYRWEVGGKVVGTGPTHVFTEDDAGRPASVRAVFARGRLSAQALSAPALVGEGDKAAPKPGASPTPSSTPPPSQDDNSNETPAKKLSAKVTIKGGKAKITVRVSVRGLARPTGTVKVKVDKAKAKSVKLAKRHKGKLTVKLPKVSKGAHKIKATYSGSALAKKATATKRVRIR